MIRAALLGATGRMGRAIIRAAIERSDITITAAVGAPGSAAQGCDAGENAGLPARGVRITCDLRAVLADCDVVVDFSTAAATLEHLLACVQAQKPLLIGTTGHAASAKRSFEAAGRSIALLIAPNASLGVTLLLELARTAAAYLPLDFDAEITDAHHRDKSDAPSGTALALGEAVAAARGEVLENVAVMSRGRESSRRPGDIGFAVIRAGDLVGEHSLLFAGPGESVRLTHRATDRAIFARGALKAAAWLAAQPAGLYSMRDIFLSKTVS